MATRAAENAEISAIISGACVEVNPVELQRLSVACYRLLMRGAPVSTALLADRLKTAQQDIDSLLERFPASAIEVDDEGNLVAFLGLSIVPANHAFCVAGRQLFTWCAFDALFLPEILRSPADLRTTCPGSGIELNVKVGPAEIFPTDPEAIVMSWVNADIDRCRDDLRGAFCNHVSLYESITAFEAAEVGRSGAIAIPLSEAFDLARQRNRERYPDIAL